MSTFQPAPFIVFLGMAATFASCANKVAPEGGPKDLAPPELVFSSPDNFSTKFNKNQIRLDFDEYIQLKEPDRQLVISPLPAEKPEISFSKKSVYINLKEPLRLNTTYTFNFGNSIIDLHESNSINNFRFVISTGDFIDSLSIKGNIKDAFTLKPVKDALVMLYSKADDSLPFTTPPDYISRSDENGNFVFYNLKSASFKLFALLDKNNNYLFDQPDESIAFHNELLNAGDSLSVELFMYKEQPSALRLLNARVTEPVKVELAFNKDVSEVKLIPASGDSGHYFTFFNQKKDSLIIFLADTLADSLNLFFQENHVIVDSVFLSLRKPAFFKAKSSHFLAPFMLTSANTRLLPGFSPEFLASHPISEIDTSRIQIYEDSIPVITCKFNIETDSRRITMSLPLQAGKNYRIIMLPNALKDCYNRYNDTLTITFQSLTEKETGSLETQIKNPSAASLLIYLVNEQEQIIRDTLLTGVTPAINFRYLMPGTYKLKAVNDKNQNGKWDTGHYLSKLFPESVVYFKEPITIRANWDVENEWLIKF